jgi:hypothetical protein
MLNSVGMEVEVVSRRGVVCTDVNGGPSGLGFGGGGITPLGSRGMCAAVGGMALVAGVVLLVG